MSEVETYTYSEDYTEVHERMEDFMVNYKFVIKSHEFECQNCKKIQLIKLGQRLFDFKWHVRIDTSVPSNHRERHFYYCSLYCIVAESRFWSLFPPTPQNIIKHRGFDRREKYPFNTENIPGFDFGKWLVR